ncbi:MAG: hemerythrin domain-containing protein [Mycobacteriales bacterium]
MTPAPVVVRSRPRPPAARPLPPPSSLAGEHLALLRDVRRRADAVLALIDAHVWPGAEVETLARYLRTTVLRQASDEEVLLFPRGASAPLAELSDDHVRLHELTGRLEHADVRSCPLPDLRALVELLLGVLQRHLAAEVAVLAALPDVPSDPPGTASAAAAPTSWLPDDGAEPVYLELGPDHGDDGVDACIERLLRLRPGERAVLRSSRATSVEQVCRWLHRFDAAGFGLERRDACAEAAELVVTRRPS